MGGGEREGKALKVKWPITSCVFLHFEHKIIKLLEGEWDACPWKVPPFHHQKQNGRRTNKRKIQTSIPIGPSSPGGPCAPAGPYKYKNNRKDIEWNIRFIFYFHIQKFQTRYSHTTSTPPNSERNVLERRYSEEGTVGSSQPPPLPSYSLSLTFIMVYFSSS